MLTRILTIIASVYSLCGPLIADIAVISDYYCSSLGLEKVTADANTEGFHAWQHLQYELQKRGDTLVLNNLHDNEIEQLHAPTTTAVIFNNPPWWSGRNLPQLLSSIKAKKILVCWEPPTVLPQMYDQNVLDLFDIVFIWDSTRQNAERVFHFCYPSLLPLQPTLKPFSERRLLTQISRNKYFNGPNELYTLRKSINEYFEAHPEFDFTFYGQQWNTAQYHKCGGEVSDKIGTLQNFRFSICFENTKNIRGYITEKIFDCFAAGNVPIYYGASDISDYIPKNCYIAWEEFGSIEKVYEHIKNIKEEEYLQYLQNIRTFVASDGAKKFTNQAFAETVLRVLDHVMTKDGEGNLAARKT